MTNIVQKLRDLFKTEYIEVRLKKKRLKFYGLQGCYYDYKILGYLPEDSWSCKVFNRDIITLLEEGWRVVEETGETDERTRFNRS